MSKVLRLGTRDSQLALYQANAVKDLLTAAGVPTELVTMKSEGDIDTHTPLYELGVQGIFTKTLDAALLGNRIDIAVHSMKDVPTHLAQGLRQAAVLPRASHKDILVFKSDRNAIEEQLRLSEDGPVSPLPFVIATSSVRRKAQWLHRYPHHEVENIRGNVNTRLRKVAESHWDGAIFAAAGLERINLRPERSLDLDWMLPAPSQGAIMVVCRASDEAAYAACQSFNDAATAFCTALEKDFLRALMGGCTTPISALAEVVDGTVQFRGNISSTDGAHQVEVSGTTALHANANLGRELAATLLQHPTAQHIVDTIRHARN